MKFLALLLAASAALTAALPTTPPTGSIFEKRQETPALTDYVYVYFTGEGTSNGEQVYMAVSNNNNPGSWTRLKNGNVFLSSNVGKRGVRDPSFIVAPDRKKFWIICTDLKVNGIGWNNNDFTVNGSKSIVIWESSDLTNWSSARLAQVSPSNAGMTWAPDAIWDSSRNAFMVFWTSSLSGSWRIMRCWTTDFVTFTTAETYLQGFGMDNTIIHDKNAQRYYMISKNGPNELIQQNVATSLNGPWTKVSENIGQGLMPAGEGPLAFQNNQNPSKWHLWVDNYTRGSGYVPMETWNLASGQWQASQGFSLPQGPRHGYVVGITASERAALLAAR